MNTSKDARVRTDGGIARDIVATVELATLAFGGVDLPDDQLDSLCEAVLSHNAECALRTEVRKGLAAARPLSSVSALRAFESRP